MLFPAAPHKHVLSKDYYLFLRPKLATSYQQAFVAAAPARCSHCSTCFFFLHFWVRTHLYGARGRFISTAGSDQRYYKLEEAHYRTAYFYSRPTGLCSDRMDNMKKSPTQKNRDWRSLDFSGTKYLSVAPTAAAALAVAAVLVLVLVFHVCGGDAGGDGTAPVNNRLFCNQQITLHIASCRSQSSRSHCRCWRVALITRLIMLQQPLFSHEG